MGPGNASSLAPMTRMRATKIVEAARMILSPPAFHPPQPWPIPINYPSMAPIRRYLRITKYSVLEVRIYLEDPSQAQPWLLNPRDPVLPRIIKAIQPLVLPKLREENERSKGKSKKAKGVKDVVSEEEFEVSIFLTDTSSRHAIMTKQKTFKEDGSRIKSNSGKLTNWLHDDSEAAPIDVDAEEGGDTEPVRIRVEDDEDEAPRLDDFPEAARGRSRPKRARTDEDDENLFVPEGEISEDEGFNSPSSKRPRTRPPPTLDEKKKLGLKTAYEGFTIYGRILCLIVKRKGNYRGRSTASGGAETGRQMLENFVSTQAQGPELLRPED